MRRLALTVGLALACIALGGAAARGSAAARAVVATSPDVTSISCPAPGDCAAAGTLRRNGTDPFVLSETNGAWGNAIRIPGLAALSTDGGRAKVSAVSCSGPGECAAGGFYLYVYGNSRIFTIHRQAFVVTEKHGVWGQAIPVPGLAKLDDGRTAEVDAISCGGAGSCSAGGSYLDAPSRQGGAQHAFVVAETHGVWGQAIEVPGMGKLPNGRHGADVVSISCAAPGDCAAGGAYGRLGRERAAFVVSEKNGRWGDAIAVAVPPKPDAHWFAIVDAVSCGAPGDCAAGGSYAADEGDAPKWRAFVVDEKNGTWGTAITVPGTAVMIDDDGNDDDLFGVDSIACAGAGDCAAEGEVDDSASGYAYSFLVDETNGSWGNAIKVPGDSHATVNALSCGAPGDCAGVGADPSPIAVSETSGNWAGAVTLPASFHAISCSAAGDCVAGGNGVVLSETNGRWGKPVRISVSP